MPARSTEHTRTGGDPANPRSLSCPRCAYDLSGPLPTWTSSCPVHATCPECGLTYQWRDIFDPLRDVPPWFFEHARKNPIRGFLSTGARALVPWRFWCNVRLVFPVRRNRLALFGIIIVGAAYLSPLVVAAAWAVRAATDLNTWWIEFQSAAVPLLAWPRLLADVYRIDTLLGIWILAALLIPFCFLSISETLSRAKIRPSHLYRAGVYSLIPHAIVGAAWSGLALLGWFYFMTFLRARPWVSVGGRWQPPRMTLLDSIMWDLSDGDLWWPLFWWPVLVVQWWCVCRFYLRITHPLAVATLLVLMGSLLATLLGFPFFQVSFEHIFFFTG